MTYKTYKYILLLFLFIHLVAGLLFGFADVNFDGLSNIDHIFKIAFGLIFYISLFLFILYAKKKGVKECNEKFSPTKLYSFITLWIVIISIMYPLSMLISYHMIEFTSAKYTIPMDELLLKLKSASTDIDKQVERRIEHASLYYKYSEEMIYYLDENNERKLYSPNESDIIGRKGYLETVDKLESLYRFMSASSILSLLLGIFVSIVYFRVRKIDKSRKLVHNI